MRGSPSSSTLSPSKKPHNFEEESLFNISSEDFEVPEEEETHLNKHLDDSIGEDLHKLFQSDQSREGMECTQDHHLSVQLEKIPQHLRSIVEACEITLL